MKKCSSKRPARLHAVAAAAFAVVAAVGVGAATLPEIFAVADRINQQAKDSQAKVDALTEETRKIYDDYKRTLKEIEGLRVYNRQLERQIAGQESEMAEISANMDKITDVQRQVTPLMERMLISLEEFIEKDLPFHPEEREARLNRLREILDRPDIAVSEQFSQVLGAFQTENDYGRAINAYSGKIETDGSERVADILHIGRVALVYQTSDGQETGYWDEQARAWTVLPDSFQAPVRRGIRMARGQASLDLLPIPVKVED